MFYWLNGTVLYVDSGGHQNYSAFWAMMSFVNLNDLGRKSSQFEGRKPLFEQFHQLFYAYILAQAEVGPFFQFYC